MCYIVKYDKDRCFSEMHLKNQTLKEQIGVLQDNDKTDIDRTTLYYRQYLRQTIIVQDIDLTDIDKTTLPIQTFMYR